MARMECTNVVGRELFPMQKCLNLLSQLSNDELKKLSQKIKEEENTRAKKETRKH